MRGFGLGILVLSLAGVGGGAWYLYGQKWWASREEASEDDETDDVDPEPEVDAGARPSHGPGKRRHGKGRAGKGAVGTHAHGGAAGGGGAPAANYGPPGRSYEAAIAGNHQQITMGGGADVPDLTDAQLSAPLRHVSFLGTCGVPDSTRVTVKVAIVGGRATGVSVYMNPPNPQAAACVDHSVRGLVWPVSQKMDSFVTTY